MNCHTKFHTTPVALVTSMKYKARQENLRGCQVFYLNFAITTTYNEEVYSSKIPTPDIA
jgi:hypothetical protein